MFFRVAGLGFSALLLTISATAAEGVTVRNLGQQVSGGIQISGDWLVSGVVWSNWDFDGGLEFYREDWGFRVYNLATDEVRNLGPDIRVRYPGFDPMAGVPPIEEAGPGPRTRFRLFGDRLVLRASEALRGEDLNGDGDLADAVLNVYDLTTGVATNIGIVAEEFSGPMEPVEPGDQPIQFTAAGKWLALEVPESSSGKDLNGDGDTEDRVIHVHDFEAEETTNLRLAGVLVAISESWLVFLVSEFSQGQEDLDGDGDTWDWVVHVYDLEAKEPANLQLTGVAGLQLGTIWLLHGQRAYNLESGEVVDIGLRGPDRVVSENWVVASVSERQAERDLNRDGDLWDRVLHAHDLDSGETRNLGLAVDGPSNTPVFRLDGEWLVFLADDGTLGIHNLVTEGTEVLDPEASLLRGYCGRTCDWHEMAADVSRGLVAFAVDGVLHLADARRLATWPFRRGDCNDDGTVDMSDAVFLLAFNFLGGEAPFCRAACDANADGDIDGTADPIYTLTHRFLGGPPPPAPYPECGPETLPAETALDCITPPVNCP